MASNLTLAAVAAASLAIGAAGGSQLQSEPASAPEIAAQQLMLSNLAQCQEKLAELEGKNPSE